MELYGYNRNDVRAQNLMTKVEDEDIFRKNFRCTARIAVTDAYFADEYKPRCLHRPYMMMEGQVESVFLEDDQITEDDPAFPNGVPEIHLMTPQKVQIKYYLEESEIQELVGKGLYRPDFNVPDNLIGNVMEIPVDIEYSAIYDTPCCFIDVLHPYELNTSSSENSYYGIFNGCRTHSEIIAEQQTGHLMTQNEQYLNQNAYEDDANRMYETEDELDEVLEEEQDVRLSDEEKEDKSIMDRLTVEMKTKLEQKQKKSDTFNAAEFIREMREDMEKEEEQQRQDTSEFGFYNEGDVSGGITSESKRRNSYEQIKRRIAMNVDIAADNKAPNEGNTDIAGMGAAEPPKETKKPAKDNAKKAESQANLAQQLLSGTYNSPNKDDGPQFL